MEGPRKPSKRDVAALVAASLVLFTAAAGAFVSSRPAGKPEPEAAAVPVTRDPRVPAAVYQSSAHLRAESRALRGSYERLLDRGRELQSVVMRASVEELEDPNGDYQRRMREYGRMWKRYQQDSARLRKNAKH